VLAGAAIGIFVARLIQDAFLGVDLRAPPPVDFSVMQAKAAFFSA
jgi:hypothetical protein